MMLRTSKTSKWGSAVRILLHVCCCLDQLSAVFQWPDLQLGQVASIPAVLHYTSPPYSSPTRLTQAYPWKAKNAPDVPWHLKSVGPKWGTITLHHPIPCTEMGHGVTEWTGIKWEAAGLYTLTLCCPTGKACPAITSWKDICWWS